jgi:hypothetical protein
MNKSAESALIVVEFQYYNKISIVIFSIFEFQISLFLGIVLYVESL